MNVLVVGSGGREHALVWKLRQSPDIGKLFCAPGNPGIADQAELVPVKVTDLEGLADFAQRESIGLTVVGPEQPLAAGIVDLFTEKGLTVFGPSRGAAELEWSKVFAKEFMARHGIPTARHRTFRRNEREEATEYLLHGDLPVVLKADGLAAGKGVIVCATREEAAAALEGFFGARQFGSAGDTVVVEEFLEGEEASVFALTDGAGAVTLAPAQDHKRALDGDRGKNTGGMGAYAPTPFVDEALLAEVRKTIIEPTIRGMADEGRTYRGCLYVGLMLTATGPKVVEYNCRFGDPETQVVLPLLEGDLLDLLLACTPWGASNKRRLPERNPSLRGSAVCVVIASPGYPDAYPSGREIAGLGDVAAIPGVVVFHAGTAGQAGRILTSGGRVLGVTAFSREAKLSEVIAAAYRAVGRIHFEGMHFRKDIGRKATIH